MNHNKSWSIGGLTITLLLLLSIALLTGAIDPFFHYHPPLDSLQYPLNNQRYQNDGIVNHFSYDALITGTSLAENFKTSEFDSLFGVNSIKVTFSGGTYSEITANLQRALEANPNIRYVIYALDEWFLHAGKDLILADGEYPTYLYDRNPFNDVNYLLNKDVFCNRTLQVLEYTKQGNQTTSFDAYSSWSFPTGLQAILPKYNRQEKAPEQIPLSSEEAQNLEENLRQNLLRLAAEYPDTQFLFFFPPYSILNWDNHMQCGTLERNVQALKRATELLLEAENIQVFSFYTDTDICTNLDLYNDTVHYNSQTNSLLLKRMHTGEYRLTKENYQTHWQEVLDFYRNYDYDAIFADTGN